MSSPGTWAGRLEPQTHRQGLFPGAGEPGGRWCLTWWFWLLRGVLWETGSRGGQAHETCAWEWHGTTSALFFASHGHGAHPDPPKGRWERTRAFVPPSAHHASPPGTPVILPLDHLSGHCLQRLLNPPACPEALISLVWDVVWEYVSF